MEWRCTNCKEVMHETDIDLVKDPESINEWSVCPHCRTPENFEPVCDEPGCSLPVSCGFPTPDGYRQTCHKHCEK